MLACILGSITEFSILYISVCVCTCVKLLPLPLVVRASLIVFITFDLRVNSYGMTHYEMGTLLVEQGSCKKMVSLLSYCYTDKSYKMFVNTRDSNH